jgi:tetratricopeptide (TPR) repeat protein
MGVALGHLGRHEEALQADTKATHLNSQHPPAWFERGVDLTNLGRHEEALQADTKATVLAPTFVPAWLGRGVDLTNLGRLEEAREAFSRATELAPKEPRAWRFLGVALNTLGRHEDAMWAFHQAAELAPNDPEIWQRKGTALKHLGRHQEALEAFTTATTLDRVYADAWVSKGQELAILGRHDEALEVFTGLKQTIFDVRGDAPDDDVEVIDFDEGDLGQLLKEYEGTDPSFAALVKEDVRRHHLLKMLTDLRKQSGKSQADVAEAMGTQQPAIARLEAGGGDPKMSTLQRYAVALGAKIQWRVVKDDLALSIRRGAGA